MSSTRRNPFVAVAVGTLLAVAILIATALIVVRVPLASHGTWVGGGTDGIQIRVAADMATPRTILWSEAAPRETAANSEVDEYEPRLSHDGMSICVVRRRPGESTEIHLSRRTPSGWSEPEPIAALGGAFDSLGPEFSRDGGHLVFSSDRPGGHGGYDLWIAERSGETFLAPRNLGSAVNTSANEYGPAYSADGAFLYFSSNRPRSNEAGEGTLLDGATAPRPWSATLREPRATRPRPDYDLYRAAVTGSGLEAAEPLTALNTLDDEGAPAISPAGDFIYFASDRGDRDRVVHDAVPTAPSLGTASSHSAQPPRHDFDLYRSRLRGDEPLGAERLDDAVNSPANELDPTLGAEGFLLVFSSDRPLEGERRSDERRQERLWSSVAREVALDPGPSIALGAWLLDRLATMTWLWMALAALLFALLLAALLRLLGRNSRAGQLGLLSRCLIASSVVHLLLALILTIWTVGTSTGDLSGGARSLRGTRVSLSAVLDSQAAEDAATSLDALLRPTPPQIEPTEPALARLAPRETPPPLEFAATRVAPSSVPSPQLPPPSRADESPTPQLALASQLVAELEESPQSFERPRPAEESIDAAIPRPAPATVTAESFEESSVTPLASESPDFAPARYSFGAPALAPPTPRSRLMEAVPSAVALPPPSGTRRESSAPLPALSVALPSAELGFASSHSLESIDSADALPPVPIETFSQRAATEREALVARMGGSVESEAAVARALAWFAAHQSSDGRWSAREFPSARGLDRSGPRASPAGTDDVPRVSDANSAASADLEDGIAEVDMDVATTSLALLCFLSAGNLPDETGSYQAVVAAGLHWLVAGQRSDGDLRRGETMYAQTIAAVALCEAYAMSRDVALGRAAEAAIDFVLSRTAGSARGGQGARGGDDTSVLGWQVMAFESARRAGLDVPQREVDSIRRWLDRIAVRGQPGRYAYAPGGAPSAAMTAEAMFVRQLLDQFDGVSSDSGLMNGSADFILSAPIRAGGDAPSHHWYYATLALFQNAAGRGDDDRWTRWNGELMPQLLAQQRRDGRAEGSWDPQDEWARLGGRVYQTAICTLSLQVYYRYRSVADRRGSVP